MSPNVTNRQALAVGALVGGATNERAARLAHVTKRTIVRWSKDETFAEAVKDGRSAALASVQHAIELGAAEGVATLRMLARITPKRLAQLGASARIRMDASRALVSILPKADEVEEARLEEVERVLGIKVTKP